MKYIYIHAVQNTNRKNLVSFIKKTFFFNKFYVGSCWLHLVKGTWKNTTIQKNPEKSQNSRRFQRGRRGAEKLKKVRSFLLNSEDLATLF